MPGAKFPEFRDGKVLSTVFTGTLSERYGTPVERIPSPARLLAWLATNGLPVEQCSNEQYRRTLQLRESIHTAATAAATEAPLPSTSVEIINKSALAGEASAQLGADGELVWALGGIRPSRVEDALSVIATDAIKLLTLPMRSRLSLCASPTCRAVFVDTSQSHTRRWCDMNTCGNRQKKARFRGTA